MRAATGRRPRAAAAAALLADLREQAKGRKGAANEADARVLLAQACDMAGDLLSTRDGALPALSPETGAAVLRVQLARLDAAPGVDAAPGMVAFLGAAHTQQLHLDSILFAELVTLWERDEGAAAAAQFELFGTAACEQIEQVAYAEEGSVEVPELWSQFLPDAAPPAASLVGAETQELCQEIQEEGGDDALEEPAPAAAAPSAGPPPSAAEISLIQESLLRGELPPVLAQMEPARVESALGAALAGMKPQHVRPLPVRPALLRSPAFGLRLQTGALCSPVHDSR
jgi:hypothetical protein